MNKDDYNRKIEALENMLVKKVMKENEEREKI